MKRARDRGEIKVSSIITLTVMAFLVYQVIQWGEPAYAVYSFGDAVREEARFGLNKDPKVITRSILEKAQELALPIAAENIAIQQQGTRTRIVVNYEVSVEWFPGQTYYWQVNVDETSKFY